MEGADGKVDRTKIEKLTPAYPDSIKTKDAAIDYIFNDKDLSLCGEHTGRSFSIGDKVNIVVANASPETRQIDFILKD